MSQSAHGAAFKTVLAGGSTTNAIGTRPEHRPAGTQEAGTAAADGGFRGAGAAGDLFEGEPAVTRLAEHGVRGVEHGNVDGRVPLEQFERFISVPGEQHCVTLALEHSPTQRANSVLILNHKHRFAAGGNPRT